MIIMNCTVIFFISSTYSFKYSSKWHAFDVYMYYYVRTLVRNTRLYLNIKQMLTYNVILHCFFFLLFFCSIRPGARQIPYLPTSDVIGRFKWQLDTIGCFLQATWLADSDNMIGQFRQHDWQFQVKWLVSLCSNHNHRLNQWLSVQLGE